MIQRSMRKFAARIHLCLAVPLGLLFFLISLSGAALVFRREIREWSHPQLYFVCPQSTTKLKPSALISCVKKGLPDSLKISSIQCYSDPSRTAMISFSNVHRKNLSVNPYNGRINGWEDKDTDLLSYIKKLHVSLLYIPTNGEFAYGKIIVGCTTLGVVFLLITGLILWWPRSKITLSKRFKIALSLGWHRFWYDNHVVGGFYALSLLLLMAFTGLSWSFPWYRSMYYVLLSGGDHTKEVHSNVTHVASEYHNTLFCAWDRVFEELQLRYPHYKHIKIEQQQAQVSTDVREGMRNFDTIFFDPQTGKICNIICYDVKPCVQKIEAMTFALHTGIWGGLFSKIITCIAALVGAVLPLTGYYLWLKKK